MRLTIIVRLAAAAGAAAGLPAQASECGSVAIWAEMRTTIENVCLNLPGPNVCVQKPVVTTDAVLVSVEGPLATGQARLLAPCLHVAKTAIGSQPSAEAALAAATAGLGRFRSLLERCVALEGGGVPTLNASVERR